MRLLGQDKEQLGIFSREDAMDQAQSEGVDLIMISNGSPPVCQLMDYGKFKCVGRMKMTSFAFREFYVTANQGLLEDCPQVS